MKRVLTIIATLALCAVIAVVPCFAIQSGWYDGQTMIQLLGAQYRVELLGVADDALVLFDTRDMYYWLFEGGGSTFDYVTRTDVPPYAYAINSIEADMNASVIYNDLLLTIDDNDDFPTADTIATTYMTSDRFYLGSDARLGLHISPIYNTETNEYLVPSGDTVSATVRFYGLNTDGDIIEAFKYRNDLIVGGTYDLTASLQEFFEGQDIQYYWIEYEGYDVVPTFVQDFSIRATVPWTDVRVVDWSTDIVYPEYISYENFNLLEWLGSAVDGFLTTTIFSIGNVNVTLGTIVSIPLTLMILIVFLKKFAGG